MSAYIVSKAHIDTLVTAAQRRAYPQQSPLFWGRTNTNPVSHGDRIGQRLWAENLASVRHLYHDEAIGTLPGPCDFDHASIAAYRHQYRRVDVVAALKALDCYEYQSCEHPGWLTSDAYAFCQQLRRRLIHCLPGYDDAPWGIEDDARFAAAA